MREVAQALSYIPNYRARYLRAKHSRLIALIVPEMNMFFFPSMITGFCGSVFFGAQDQELGETDIEGEPARARLERRVIAAADAEEEADRRTIRGRTRDIGNELVLACDMRFASRQSALFGNPEIGVGLVPGGGALEWLPRLVGRSRALEIVLSGDDFDADIAERYGWVNRTLDDDKLDSFVDTLVQRLASFDRETLAAAKAQINRFGTPTAAELQSSNDLFFPLLACPVHKDAVPRSAISVTAIRATLN